MTVKAGQKCTAIRRVIVPRKLSDAVADALGKRLGKAVIGDPRDEAVSMGPLASAGQREEVLARVSDLKVEAEIVSDFDGSSPATGAFAAPVLLHCANPMSAEAVHSVEAFGPVATLMPYDELEEAVELTHKGKGSLVASLFTNDPSVAEEAVLGMAPFHGRVMIGNRKECKVFNRTWFSLAHACARRTGPGRWRRRTWRPALGQTLHATDGGPGNARLAGRSDRPLGFRCTRSGRQPAPVPQVIGRPQDRRSAEHRGTGSSLEDIEHFAKFTGDTFYAHMNEAAAKRNPFFEGRVAHGYLIVSFAAGLFVDPDEGPVLANYGVDNLRFLTPVNAGDALKVQLTAKEFRRAYQQTMAKCGGIVL